MSKPIGKACLQRCVEDIECMKESCSLLQTAISRIALKICIIVLSILIALPLLERNVFDVSRDQGLAFLQKSREYLTTHVNGKEVGFDASSFCRLMSDYADQHGDRSGKLELLIVDNRVYKDDLVDIDCGSQAPKVDGKLMDYAKSKMDLLDLQPTELRVHCYPESAPDHCSDAKVRALAVWNISEEAFQRAKASLFYTAVVIVMMCILVVFFA